MKKFTFLLAFLSPLYPSQAQSADTLKLIDNIFTRWHNATPGGAVLVARGEKLLYNKAFGLADLEHNVPNTPETIFETGSIAKQVTALSILLLADQGKLSLQDDIRKYLPEMPVYSTPITIQQMINHSSGLKEWGSLFGLSGWQRTTRVYTQQTAFQTITKQSSTNFPPGSEYAYSNTNYILMTFIIERISKMSLADFTRTMFFEPLGMTHTQWRDNFRKVVPNRAVAYSGSVGNFQQAMPFENVHGPGGLLTTTGDLLKWNSLLENHCIGGDKIFQQRITRGRLKSGQEITYAAGLVIGELNGFREIAHSGGTAGYRAWLAYYPQKKLTVIIMSNEGALNPVAAGRSAAEVFLGKAAVNTTDRKKISLSETDQKKFDGVYRSIRHFDTQKLEFMDGKIISNEKELYASHRDTLFLDNLVWAFSRAGVIKVIRANDTLSYTKMKAPDTTPAYLNTLRGEYRSKDVDINYNIDVKDNTLWVTNRPFPPFALTPRFMGGFQFEDRLYEFKKNKSGKVMLEVSMPGAERIPFVKK